MPNVSNKVHKFPFRFIYDMGELMGVGGGGLDYLKSCNKHIYSYRNYQHPGMHFLFESIEYDSCIYNIQGLHTVVNVRLQWEIMDGGGKHEG